MTPLTYSDEAQDVDWVREPDPQRVAVLIDVLTSIIESSRPRDMAKKYRDYLRSKSPERDYKKSEVEG